MEIEDTKGIPACQLVDAKGMPSRGRCELRVHSSAGQSHKHGLAKGQYLVGVYSVSVQTRSARTLFGKRVGEDGLINSYGWHP